MPLKMNDAAVAYTIVAVSNIKHRARFFFSHKRRKRKSYQKENAVGEFRSLRRATAVSSAAHDKVLKKLEQNFSAEA